MHSRTVGKLNDIPDIPGEGKWASNIPLSVILELIRAVLRRATSGKSTSNTTALMSASSACRRKYKESNPAPKDRI